MRVGIAQNDTPVNGHGRVHDLITNEVIGTFIALESIRQGTHVSISGDKMRRSKPEEIFGAGVKVMSPSPADHLAHLVTVFAAKNTEYGAAYEIAGTTLDALFPNGVHLTKPKDFTRFAMVARLVDKLTRYARNFSEGGHPDSLDDLSILSAILFTVDASQ